MYEEMMMNTDNLESSLQTSIFWYKLHTSSCRVPASMKCVVQVLSVGNIYPYIALQSIIVYTEVQWVAH